MAQSDASYAIVGIGDAQRGVQGDTIMGERLVRGPKPIVREPRQESWTPHGLCVDGNVAPSAGEGVWEWGLWGVGGWAVDVVGGCGSGEDRDKDYCKLGMR